jgi:PIN domain nuclease of toxin-antitoxin system
MAPFVRRPLAALQGDFRDKVATNCDQGRLGKLIVDLPMNELPAVIRQFDTQILPIKEEHALIDVDPEPPTKVTFDRPLPGHCRSGSRQLVTVDQALTAHPLAWKPVTPTRS